jgi:predicted metal-binding protein
MASGLKRSVRSDWTGTILICRKCSKKLGGGFGPKGKARLAKALRKRFGLKNGRKAAFGVIEVGCLGVCPYGAVTVIDATEPGRWRIIPAGSDLDEVAIDLGLAAKAVQRA